VPSEDGEKWIITAIRLKDISNLTYNAVDLGLPSGLKWADRNVGATSPEHYGSYFQWGDTNAYTYEESAEITTEQLVDIFNPLIGPGITVDNVKDVLASQGVTSNDLRAVMQAGGINAVVLNKNFARDSYFDTTDAGNTFNKYNNNGGLTVLESSDDAATVHIGSQYRMPTIDELEELVYNTTQTFIDLNGNEYSKEQAKNGAIERGKLKGVRFTGSNSNSIIIPSAGSCQMSNVVGINSSVLLYTSSLYMYNDGYASHLTLDADGYVETRGANSRSFGFSVRGVTL
jgi:hypothetical protein